MSDQTNGPGGGTGVFRPRDTSASRGRTLQTRSDAKSFVCNPQISAPMAEPCARSSRWGPYSASRPGCSGSSCDSSRPQQQGSVGSDSTGTSLRGTSSCDHDAFEFAPIATPPQLYSTSPDMFGTTPPPHSEDYQLNVFSNDSKALSVAVGAPVRGIRDSAQGDSSSSSSLAYVRSIPGNGSRALSAGSSFNLDALSEQLLLLQQQDWWLQEQQDVLQLRQQQVQRMDTLIACSNCSNCSSGSNNTLQRSTFNVHQPGAGVAALATNSSSSLPLVSFTSSGTNAVVCNQCYMLSAEHIPCQCSAHVPTSDSQLISLTPFHEPSSIAPGASSHMEQFAQAAPACHYAAWEATAATETANSHFQTHITQKDAAVAAKTAQLLSLHVLEQELQQELRSLLHWNMDT